MAILHTQASLRPTKLEVLTSWLPTRAWYQGPASPGLNRVAGYRFDDPAGEVGIETLLVRAGDARTHHVPLTYRGAPLDGGDDWLVGTSEHSVLGPRWIYDACGDPVYASVLAATILTGAAGAEEYADIDGQLIRREQSMTVRGSGAQDGEPPTINTIVRVGDEDPTLVATDTVELAVRRVLDLTGRSVSGELAALTGIWSGQSSPVLLATLNADRGA